MCTVVNIGPVNDVSRRGTMVDDIVHTIALTIQASQTEASRSSGSSPVAIRTTFTVRRSHLPGASHLVDLVGILNFAWW